MIPYELDINKFNLSYFCPECKQQVRGIPKTDALVDVSHITDQLAYLIVQCPTTYCRHSFVIYDRLNRRIVKVFPQPDTQASDYHESIPENIREDFAEAKKCYFADAYKGVVVLCRRVVQQVVRNKILDQNIWKMNLYKQTDELLKEGLITKSLHELSTEIRYFGNFGAHPQDDGLDNISDEDASTIIRFTEELLIDLYIRPFETAKMSIKRKAVKNNNGK